MKQDGHRACALWRKAGAQWQRFIPAPDGDFKTFTSKSFIKIINESPESTREWLLHMFNFYARQTVANKQYKIWTNNNHPEEVFSQDFFYQKLQYIHYNPVRAGIVFEGIDYIYHSASNYVNQKSVFNIDFLW